ncbi:MAG: flagellar FliJ family protein [Crocinitomicaceae bacterium]|nr:flagellar FliJ family protein [Crocinitomicaceae bacterium]
MKAAIAILLPTAMLCLNLTRVVAQSDVPKISKAKDFDFKGVLNRLSGLENFSLPQPEKDSLGHRIGQTLLKDIKSTSGHIDLGYSYGLNTVFIDSSRSIGSIFNATGDFSTSVLSMPINVSFNYSTLRVPLGANNYFRISLDKDRLVKQQQEKLTASVANIENQQAALAKKQSELSGLMGYVEVYLDKLKRTAEREAMKQKDALAQRAKDSLSSRRDSIDLPDATRPDLSVYTDHQRYYDSVLQVYQKIVTIKNTYDSLSGALSGAKEKLTAVKSGLNTDQLTGMATEKVGFLKSIKALDIGLTYPKTTGLSGQNVPIKGLHSEFQFQKIYLSVASGLTLNNIMLSTNEVQNQLTYNQNVFNNFDFQQVINNGWLTTIKTGYGTPEGTHAFVGFNYLTNTRFLNPSGSANTQPTYDPAATMELDFRYVPTFTKGTAVDLVYGKTSLNRQFDTITQSGVFESLFSGYASHVLLGKITQAVSNIKSDFAVSYRLVDTYANTTTYGMMQPNNQRIEFISNHRVAKFMKVGLLYRFDETLRAIPGMSQLRLHMTGGNIAGSYTSYFSYSAFLNHVRHTIAIPGTEQQRGNNYLVGLNLSSNYNAGALKANSTITYNDYLISDTSGMNKYTQLGLMQSIGERHYSMAASYDYFFRRLDGLASGTNVFGLMGKYKFDRVQLGAGVKIASDFVGATSLGGHLEALWQVYRFLDVSLRAERFVLGDFYRTYYRSQYEQFPYLMTLQTRFKI